MWTMEFNRRGTHLAAGCEDGTVRLFNSNCGILEYTTSFTPQESRILSLSWHPSGDHIVTGGADSQIQKWSVSEGRTVLRISLDQFKEKSTIVWAIACLSDDTIISGDSLGKIQFWNGKFGTLKQSFQLHTADVLALTVSDSDDVVYASGVDNKIVQLQLIENLRRGHMWVNTNSVRCHTHDIRALTLCREILVSGGVDTNLILHDVEMEFNRDKAVLVPPFPQFSRVSLAPTARILLLQYPQHLHVWSLGQEVEDKETDLVPSPDQFEMLAAPPEEESAVPTGLNVSNEEMKLQKESQLLLDICSSGHHHLLSSTISVCGKFVAFSDVCRSRVVCVSNLTGVSSKKRKHLPKVSPVSSDPHCLPPAHRLAFTPDSSQLIIAGTSALVHVTKIRDNHISVLHSFSEHSARVDGKVVPVVLLQVSQCGRFLATGDLANRLYIYDLSMLSCISTLPIGLSSHTAIGFQPGNTVLVTCSSNKRIHLFDFVKGQFTEWSRKAASKGLPQQWLNHGAKVDGICFSEQYPCKMVLWGHSVFCTVDLSEPLPHPKSTIFSRNIDGKPAAKRRKDDNDMSFKMSKVFSNLMFFSYFGGGSAVAVERPWHDVLQKLPQALFRVRYGT